MNKLVHENLKKIVQNAIYQIKADEHTLLTNIRYTAERFKGDPQLDSRQVELGNLQRQLGSYEAVLGHLEGMH